MSGQRKFLRGKYAGQSFSEVYNEYKKYRVGALARLIEWDDWSAKSPDWVSFREFVMKQTRRKSGVRRDVKPSSKTGTEFRNSEGEPDNTFRTGKHIGEKFSDVYREKVATKFYYKRILLDDWERWSVKSPDYKRFRRYVAWRENRLDDIVFYDNVQDEESDLNSEEENFEDSSNSEEEEDEEYEYGTNSEGEDEDEEIQTNTLTTESHRLPNTPMKRQNQASNDVYISPWKRQRHLLENSDSRDSFRSCISPNGSGTEHLGTPTKKSKTSLDESEECIICCDAKKDGIFIKCGHLCVCYNCGKKLRECPICRKKGKVQKVFF
eukprot:g3663.t1